VTVSFHPRALALAPLAALAILPASASARSVSGQALAAPTAAGARLSLPVLLSQRSVRRNHLRSPVVTLSLGRNVNVASGAGGQNATPLGFGDQLTATVKVPKAAQRSAFPMLKASKVRLLAHATDAQEAELAQKLAALTQTVSNLSNYVQQLAAYTYTQFGIVFGDIAQDHTALTGLTSNLASLQSQLDALSAQIASLNVPALSSQLTTLSTTVDGLTSQVPQLVSGLDSVTSGLSGVESVLGGIQPGQLSQALTDIGSLQTITSGLDVSSIDSQLATLESRLQAVLASIGTVSGTDLQTQIDNLSSTLSGVSSSLATAISRINVVCSASNNLLTGPLSLIGVTHFAGC
jgi:prefoldin subunit 5